jgi:C-terminal processing protease CtpA/Prc
MALTASADGMIIDLRQNGGGYGDTVAELQRYFLPADAPMSERFDRPSGKTYVGRMSKTVPTHHFGEKPLYILTSKRTFSGAEAFAYSMQARGRGTVVGETSRGGANPVQVFQLSPNFALFLPTGRAIDAVTRTNWEGTGVRPDQPVDASEAQAVAYRHLLELLSSRATDPTVRDELRDAMAGPAPPSTPKP